MEKEVKGFAGNLEYFLFDDDARWKAIRWIIVIVGCFGSLDLTIAKSPVGDAVFAMGTLALVLSIGWIAWHCSFAKRRDPAPRSYSRRTLVFQLASFIAFGFSLRLPQAEAHLAERKLQQASVDPTSPQSIQDATLVLTRARDASVKIAPAALEAAGRKFLDAGADNEAAWDAVMAFLSYRSFLNMSVAAALLKDLPFVVGTKYGMFGTGSDAVPSLNHAGSVPISKAAKLNAIGLNENAGREKGDAFLVMENGGIRLDDLESRECILRDVHVIYAGGPVILENVVFVNCVFTITNQSNAEMLVNQVLKNSAVTLKAS